MVVFKDVLRMPDARAREVKSWAVRALVRQALQDTTPRPPSRRRLARARVR